MFLEDGRRCAPPKQFKVGLLVWVDSLPGENQAVGENLAGLRGEKRVSGAGSSDQISSTLIPADFRTRKADRLIQELGPRNDVRATSYRIGNRNTQFRASHQIEEIAHRYILRRQAEHDNSAGLCSRKLQ